MVACRFIYSLVPLTLTVGSLVLSLLAFFGSFKSSTSVTNKIYYMQLNLSNITVSGYELSSLARDAGIYPIYQVGASGYCYGTIDANEKVNLTECASPSTPFWFDLLGIFEKSRAGDILSRVNLPQEVSNYNRVIKGSSAAHWCLLIVTAGLSFIMLCLGLFSAWSKGLSCCILLISILNAVAAVAAAAIATAIFSVYHTRFNETVNEFGATAKLGATGFGLVWGAALAAVLGAFFWTFTACCGSTDSGYKEAES